MNGFELEDALDTKKRTPLLLLCQTSENKPWGRTTIRLIRWFLDRGAFPNFFSADSWPNLNFYIAVDYAERIRIGLHRFPRSFKRLIQRSVTLCDPLCLDDCQCHCSSAGCLPFYKFWRFDAMSYEHHEACKSITSATIFDDLRNWLYLYGIDET